MKLSDSICILSDELKRFPFGPSLKIERVLNSVMSFSAHCILGPPQANTEKLFNRLTENRKSWGGKGKSENKLAKLCGTLNVCSLPNKKIYGGK